MSVGQYGTGHEFVTIIDSTGLETVLPVREGGTVARQSLAATTQVVTIGDNSRRQDLRTPQVIFTDQSGGMGEFGYTETEGILTFTQSDCDTRYASGICLPPQPASLGSLGTYGALPAIGSQWGQVQNPIRIEYLMGSPATLLAYIQNGWGTNYDQELPQFYNGSSWAVVTGIATAVIVSGVAVFGGRVYFTNVDTTGTPGVYSSPNTAAFTRTAYTCVPSACVVHDNKFYLFNQPGGTATSGRLEWTTDPTIGTGWSVSGGTLYLQPSEYVRQMVEWRAGNRTAIYLLTTQRILWYDEDADAWSVFNDFTRQVSRNATPLGHVWLRDGNLYTIFGDDGGIVRDAVMWFSGTTNVTGPNMHGGLPSDNRLPILGLAGGLHWLYAWTGSFGTSRTAPPGRLMAMNDQQGWHTLYSGNVIGGGYGNGNAYIVAGDLSVWTVPLPDNTDIPLYATGRTYTPNTTLYHEYAYTDAGTDNMDKQALWVTVQARDMTSANKAQGLPTGCSVVVQYLRDVDASWTTIGTLTSASTFPAVLPIAGGYGVTFKQIKLRIGLASTTTTLTPIVTSVALAFTRRPVQRYAYQIPVDLTRHVFGRTPVQPGPGGLNAAAIRARLEGYTQPGQMVKLRFGGNTTTSAVPQGTTVGPCQLTLGGSEGPTWGPGQYLLTLTDLSAPSSG